MKRPRPRYEPATGIGQWRPKNVREKHRPNGPRRTYLPARYCCVRGRLVSLDTAIGCVEGCGQYASKDPSKLPWCDTCWNYYHGPCPF